MPEGDRPGITRVICAAAAPGVLAPVFQAIGATATALDDDRLRIEVGGGVIEYVADDQGPTGIVSIEVSVPGLDRAGVHDAHGIEVILHAEAADPKPVDAVRLDHVALVVRDLDAAARTWSRLTGCDAEMMGVHPVSNGAFEAARVILGNQMIELITPVDGQDSPMARRLASRGEGPATLALPVRDLEAAIGRLAGIGVGVLRAPPHVMLHPRDTSGVLIQLTPRVEH